MFILIMILALAADLAPGPGAGAPADSAASDSVALLRALGVGGVASPPARAPAVGDTLPLGLRRVAIVVAGGGADDRLAEPAGVAVDAFGRIVVSDAGLNRVQRYDARGAWIGGAGTLGSDPGQFRRPGAVAGLGNFGVAILDRENRRVVSYDLNGRLVGTLIDLTDPALSDQIGYVNPIAMAADRGGAVVIADADQDRLLTFDFSGRYQRTIGGYGGRAGSFRSLSGVAAGPHGELVTTDRAHARAQRLDAGGRPVAAWTLPVTPGRGALAVAVDDSSRVAIADEDSGRLWVYAAAGRLLAAASGLAAPRALAFAPDGTLLVAESGAGRVSRWALVSTTAAGGG